MNLQYVCSRCKETIPFDIHVIECKCGGILLCLSNSSLPEMDIHTEDFSLWRHSSSLPFNQTMKSWESVTLGEGFSPIIPLDYENTEFYLKMELASPGSSYHARGAAVLLAKAKELGVKKLILNAGGKFGKIIALYAKRAGISCEIYLSHGTSDREIEQLNLLGSIIHINDESDKEIEKVMDGKEDYLFLPSVYHPLFIEGLQTFAYEIVEQQSNRLPDSLVIPLDEGGLLLATYYGFNELLDKGLIDKLPQLIVVKEANMTISKQMETKIKEVLNITNATVLSVQLSEKNQAYKALLSRGLLIDSVTAAAYAGYMRYFRDHALNDKRVLMSVSGDW